MTSRKDRVNHWSKRLDNLSVTEASSTTKHVADVLGGPGELLCLFTAGVATEGDISASIQGYNGLI